MPKLPGEELSTDVVTIVLIDTVKGRALELAEEISNLALVENSVVVAAVYWVAVTKGQYDLKAGVRARELSQVSALVLGKSGIVSDPDGDPSTHASIENTEGVLSTSFEHESIRFVNGARDGGP